MWHPSDQASGSTWLELKMALIRQVSGHACPSVPWCHGGLPRLVSLFTNMPRGSWPRDCAKGRNEIERESPQSGGALVSWSSLVFVALRLKSLSARRSRRRRPDGSLRVERWSTNLRRVAKCEDREVWARWLCVLRADVLLVKIPHGSKHRPGSGGPPCEKVGAQTRTVDREL
jgi:hypothetical protein